MGIVIRRLFHHYNSRSYIENRLQIQHVWHPAKSECGIHFEYHSFDGTVKIGPKRNKTYTIHTLPYTIGANPGEEKNIPKTFPIDKSLKRFRSCIIQITFC